MNASSDREIAAVVFDVGGVLLDWNPRYLYRKLMPDPVQMAIPDGVRLLRQGGDADNALTARLLSHHDATGSAACCRPTRYQGQRTAGP